MAVAKMAVLRRLREMLLLGVMLASPLFLFAQTGTPPDPPAPSNTPPSAEPWRKGITVNGFASLSYTYNTNDPIPQSNQFRVFDFNDDEPQLDVAQLVIQRSISKPNQFDFLFDLTAGSGTPPVTAAYGLFRNSRTGIGEHVDIPQMYLSYIAPLGQGLRFDFGKFVTHMGYESIPGYDGYNNNFSQSFLFGYGIPFTHTGLRMTYPFSNRISAIFTVNNGWDDIQKVNGGYTVGGQLSVATSQTTHLVFNFVHGPEHPHDNSDQTNDWEIIATWTPGFYLSFALDGLYGHQDNGVAPGQAAIWRDLAGYARFYFTHRLSLAFRGEVFRDGGGVRTGTNQTLREYTLTPSYDLPAEFSKINPRFKGADGTFVIRADLRRDFSDHATFRKGGNSWTDQQSTAAVNLIYQF